MFDAGLKLFRKVKEGIKQGAQEIYDWIKNTFTPNMASQLQSMGIQMQAAGTTTVRTPNGTMTVKKNAKGSVVEKGEIAFLEGDGAEAVVPLDQNKKWIHKVAQDMQNETYQYSASNPNIDKTIEELNQTIQELPLAIMNAIASGNVRIDVGNRDFGRLVKAVNA